MCERKRDQMGGSSKIEVSRYLERIGLKGRRLKANSQGLEDLQLAHLLAVPFENLDIHWRRPIILDRERFYDKIVNHGRGGFCYELNGLFEELLKEIGFETYLISARVFSGARHGPEFDHAAIIVTIGKERFLADVGFGDFTAKPLRFVLDDLQPDRHSTFKINKFSEDYFEVTMLEDPQWKSLYIFKDEPRELSEFSGMCDFHQFSPSSHFAKGKLCSIMIDDGRKTLTDHKMSVARGAGKSETPIHTDEEFYRLLDDEFGIKRIQ